MLFYFTILAPPHESPNKVNHMYMTWKFYFPGTIWLHFDIALRLTRVRQSVLFTQQVLRNTSKPYLAIRADQMPSLLRFNLFHLTPIYKEFFRHFY